MKHIDHITWPVGKATYLAILIAVSSRNIEAGQPDLAL